MMKPPVFIFCFSLIAAACGLGPDMSKDRIPPAPTPTPFIPDRTSVEYIRLGDAALAAGNHSGAISPYRRAFEIEKDDHRLERKQFYSLVSKLAILYARAGDSKNARITAAYGISKKYHYPLFHYTLACSYAAEDDESNALYHLENAYEFKKKLDAGEIFPDPLSDESFAGLSHSSTFKSAVARMKK